MIYEVADDELVEDENLLISGETPLLDIEDTEADDDIPVRLLQDFVFYDMDTNEVIPLVELMQLQYVERLYGASGIVTPWVEDDGQDQEMDEEEFELVDGVEMVGIVGSCQRVKLSKIIELNVHAFSEQTKRLDRCVHSLQRIRKHKALLAKCS